MSLPGGGKIVGVSPPRGGVFKPEYCMYGYVFLWRQGRPVFGWPRMEFSVFDTGMCSYDIISYLFVLRQLRPRSARVVVPCSYSLERHSSALSGLLVYLVWYTTGFSVCLIGSPGGFQFSAFCTVRAVLGSRFCLILPWIFIFSVAVYEWFVVTCLFCFCVASFHFCCTLIDLSGVSINHDNVVLSWFRFLTSLLQCTVGISSQHQTKSVGWSSRSYSYIPFSFLMVSRGTCVFVSIRRLILTTVVYSSYLVLLLDWLG